MRIPSYHKTRSWSNIGLIRNIWLRSVCGNRLNDSRRVLLLVILIETITSHQAFSLLVGCIAEVPNQETRETVAANEARDASYGSAGCTTRRRGPVSPRIIAIAP